MENRICAMRLSSSFSNMLKEIHCLNFDNTALFLDENTMQKYVIVLLVV
jgi:hypothetical protein